MVEQVKDDMVQVETAVISCVNAEQLLSAYNLVDSLETKYGHLKKKKKTRWLYESIEQFVMHQRTRISMLMHKQLTEKQ